MEIFELLIVKSQNASTFLPCFVLKGSLHCSSVHFNDLSPFVCEKSAVHVSMRAKEGHSAIFFLSFQVQSSTECVWQYADYLQYLQH